MEKEKIAKLVQQAQSGDGEAMSDLLQLAHGSVIFQCRKIMAHPEDAEDMAQEVLIKVYEKLDTLQEPERFLSWANTIAARLCLNDRQRNPKDLQFAEDEEGHSILDNLEDLDQQNVPDTAIDNAETRRMIVELIDALPEAQRTSTYLYYYDELSVKEIAELVGVSENTIKSRLNYARKAIKDGVLDYEKKGVKLYGLSPLPFLLYFLRGAAEIGANPTMAATAAKVALSAEGVAAVAAATSESAAAGAAAGAPTGAAGAVSGGTSSGLFGTTATKITAGVLAGAVTIGGVGVLLSQEEEPPPEPTPIVETIIPETIPIAEYTIRRTEVDTGRDDIVIYIETPEFEEVSEGYRNINALFDEIHTMYEEHTDHNVLYILTHLDEVTEDGPLVCSEVYTVESQDSETVKIHHVYEFNNGGSIYMRQYSLPEWPLTFDVATGELQMKNLEGKREAARKNILERYGSDSLIDIVTNDEYRYGEHYDHVYYREQFGFFGM